MDLVIRKFGAQDPKHVQAGSTGILEFLLQKLKDALYCLEWPFEELKQGLVALVNFVGSAFAWLGNAFLAPLHFAVEKIQQGFIALENIGAEALAWLHNGFLAPLHYVVDKLKEGGIAVEHFAAEAFAWLRNGFGGALPSVVDKLKEGAIAVKHFGVVALAWLGKAFWVTLPYMIAILVIVLLVYFWRIFWSVCFGGVRMMRAPGMACIRIPRAMFEASPRIYFIIQRIILGVYRSVCALFRGLAALFCCCCRR